MRGIYCGHVLDTEEDAKIVTAGHADGAETLYLTTDGYYYFVINDKIGFTEPEGMKRWVYDHFEDPAGILERIGDAMPACKKESPIHDDRPRNDRPKSGKPSIAWYLLPVLLGMIGGILMCIILYNKDRTMAKNGLLLGVAMFFVGIILILVANL
ncbi:MAG: hypothetical protein D9C04_07145 [Nitrosopumilus sp. B06]|nr:MAG: hypothetical protein D9C04_07145 [Nitrosopumilus sp. B06]